MLDAKQARKINSTIAKITRQAKTQMQQNQAGTGALSSDRKIDTRISNDRSTKLAKKISFAFNRNWVFIEKGAKRGHAGEKGSVWTDAQGRRKRTNPKSFGKMNRGASPAKPWFNPAIKPYVEQLTKAVAADFADISFDRLKIK